MLIARAKERAHIPMGAAIVLLAWLAASGACRRADDVETIVELEQRLAAAWVEGDRAFIDALLASDWSVTSPDGRVLTKQQVLEETFASADRRIDTMAVDDLHVRILGDAAVATGRTRATGSYRGTAASVMLRFTDVLVRRDGRWQVVVSHGTLVDESDAVP